MLEISLDNLEEVKKALDSWGDLALEAVKKGLRDDGEHLLAASQKLAFQLTGDLMGSGTLEMKGSGDTLMAEVGFHTEYAARRHEEPGYYDRTNAPGRITRGKPSVDGMVPGRKYLERPLLHYQEDYLENIAEEIRKLENRG